MGFVPFFVGLIKGSTKMKNIFYKAASRQGPKHHLKSHIKPPFLV